MTTSTTLPPSGEVERVVEALMAGFATDERRPYRVGRTSLHWADVAHNIESLSDDVFAWKRITGEGFPCLLDQDGAIPMLVSARQPFANTFPFTPFPDAFHVLIQPLYAAHDIRVVYSRVPEVVEVVRHRLTAFLNVRADESPEPLRALPVGAAPAGFSEREGFVEIQVHTPGMNNLRIQYTPSYFIDWSNVLNAPTSPVDGWIRPGKYKFGGKELFGRGDFLIDNTNFDIPRLRTVYLALK